MLPEKQTHAKRKKYSATVSSVLELGAEHTKWNSPDEAENREMVT